LNVRAVPGEEFEDLLPSGEDEIAAAGFGLAARKEEEPMADENTPVSAPHSSGPSSSGPSSGPGQRSGGRPSGGPGGGRKFFRRKKVCKFCTEKIDAIPYRDVRLLQGFVAERGKIVPRRLTGVCTTHQRRLTRAIKQARNIALLPFAARF
jgi:small subunit ribosomal protein S18